MNRLEWEFREEAIRRGFKVLRMGWPDFLIHKDGVTQAIEVKGPNDYVREEQMSMMNTLANAGVECWVYRGEWKKPDIVKSTEKEDIIEDLFKYYAWMVKRLRSKTKKLQDLYSSLPYELKMHHWPKRRGVKTGEVLEELLKIINEHPSKKSITLHQKWRNLHDKEKEDL